MALSARYLIDTSAAARMRHPIVAERLTPLIEAGLVASCATLDAEALYSARSQADYEQIRANRRDAYEHLPTEERHWQAAFAAQRALARSGRHRAVGIVDLLTAVIGAEHHLTLIHYGADFDIAADVISFNRQWVAPRGSIP